nr:reverse transcriptase domain-containing protein [Tanacetum cinerariifolium]
MTATLKDKDVPNDAIKLMLFPYSLEDRDRIWENNFQNNQGYRAQMNNVSNFQNQGFQNQPFSVTNNQILPSVPNAFSTYIKSNEIAIKSMQNQINVLRGDFSKQEENLRRNLNDDMRNILSSFFQNQPSTSGTLPSNTIPNPKGEMKTVTTRSGLAYEGPSIPTKSSLEKIDEQNIEDILDKEHSKSSGSTAQVQPLVVPISISKADVPRTQSKSSIPYPSRLNDQNLREKATNQMELFFQIFHDLHFDISFADTLLLMQKFSSTIKSLLANKDKLFELAKVPLNENCSAMLLKKLLEKLRDPVVDFEADPRVPLILGRSFLRIDHALIDIYGEEITLRVNDESITFNLNQTMRYSLTYDDTSNPKSSSPTLVFDDLISESDSSKDSNKLPIIIAKNLKVDEREALINVLKSHKWAIAWKISDIKGIDPRFFTHEILMEDDYKPAVQSQRRVNPKIHDVIKKEVIKLLDA